MTLSPWDRRGRKKGLNTHQRPLSRLVSWHGGPAQQALSPLSTCWPTVSAKNESSSRMTRRRAAEHTPGSPARTSGFSLARSPRYSHPLNLPRGPLPSLPPRRRTPQGE
eukprot:scaffold183389_cov35-Tisochrysis_lutea.AAC.3